MIEILRPAQLAQAHETGALVAGILRTLKSRSIVGTNLLDIATGCRTAHSEHTIAITNDGAEILTR